jgi:CheY-like chemotaxis protein
MPESVRLAVEYDGPDDLVGDFTENLSSGRTFVATDLALAVGTPVQLVLSFPGLVEPIAIDGTVSSTRGDGPEGVGGVGIDFDAAGGARLAATIDRIRNRDPKVVSRLLRVLFVEDNRHVAAMIQDGIRTATRREFGGGVSFVFRNAEDGHSAVELLRQESFDALIVDVYLPLLDGPHVIAHVRGQLGLPDLPIIAVSAGGDNARRSALDAGANIFLDKPMRLRQVLDAIRRVIPMASNDDHATGLAAAT